MRNDEELQRDVLNELKSDKRLCIEDLSVRVERRAVTLTGRARTAAERWRALEIARHVAGIAPVSNLITVAQN